MLSVTIVTEPVALLWKRNELANVQWKFSWNWTSIQWYIHDYELHVFSGQVVNRVNGLFWLNSYSLQKFKNSNAPSLILPIWFFLTGLCWELGRRSFRPDPCVKRTSSSTAVMSYANHCSKFHNQANGFFLINTNLTFLAFCIRLTPGP